MRNSVIAKHDEREDEDPIVRVIYALGIALTAVGPMLPEGNKWMILGVALITFCAML
jgi:hypothetical protein